MARPVALASWISGGGTFYDEFRDGTVQGKGVYVYRKPDPTTEMTGINWTLVNRVPSSLGGRWYSGLNSGETWQGYGMLCYNYSYYIGEVKYPRETDMFLIPIGSYCKKYYPQYANAFSIMKSSIETLNSSMEMMLERVENRDNFIHGSGKYENNGQNRRHQLWGCRS